MKKMPLDNDKFFCSSLSFATQEELAQDEDEPRGLSSSCAIQKNKHKMIMSLLVCCCLLQPKKKKPQDENELPIHCCFLELKKI